MIMDLKEYTTYHVTLGHNLSVNEDGHVITISSCQISGSIILALDHQLTHEQISSSSSTGRDEIVAMVFLILLLFMIRMLGRNYDAPRLLFDVVDIQFFNRPPQAASSFNVNGSIPWWFKSKDR